MSNEVNLLLDVCRLLVTKQQLAQVNSHKLNSNHPSNKEN